MPCTERRTGVRWRRIAMTAAGAFVVVLAGCHSSPEHATEETANSTSTGGARASAATNATSARTPATTAPQAPAAKAGLLALPEPRTMANWAQVRRQAAERLVAANPSLTYTGKVPDQLLAIPVLEVELNGDGSVRRIEILREPRQARDTMKIAIEAIRRAAPYGNVSKLPKPWKFVETFLFDEARRFKPRTLDP